MKQQVRIGVFETNSSSTHTLVLCNKEMWKKFKTQKNNYFSIYQNSVITKEDIENSNDYQTFVNDNYPDFNDLDKDEKADVFDEYLLDEGLYNKDDLYYEYNVLVEEVPDSDYIAVSFYSPE